MAADAARAGSHEQLAAVGAFVELARPGNVIMAAVGVVVGALVVGLSEPTAEVLLASLATAFVVAGGNAFNDIADVEVDRRVHPRRPLPAGRLGVRAAIGFALASFLAALALAVAVSFELVLLVLAAEAVLTAYEVHLKASGLVGNFVVALLVGATFIAGGLAVGSITPTLGFLAGLAFLANVGREVWKDAQDVHGDEERRTLARVHGGGTARVVAGVLTLAAVALSPLPYLVSGFGGSAFLWLVALADVVFVFAVAAPEPGRAQRLSKVGMTVALAAFVVGALA